jgi:hypothetical protein
MTYDVFESLRYYFRAGSTRLQTDFLRLHDLRAAGLVLG